jgi:hypothetical protein
MKRSAPRDMSRGDAEPLALLTERITILGPDKLHQVCTALAAAVAC